MILSCLPSARNFCTSASHQIESLMRGEQTTMRCWAKTDHAEYDVTGEVISMIPLRNRRTTPEGEQLHTRITEAMTRFECDGLTGIGMSEFLDQVVDGWPIGVPRP